MRSRIVAAVVGAALVGAAPAAQASTERPSRTAPVAFAAHECSNGYTHARIGGEHKCLRRGQFCAKRHRKRYRRYEFRCRWDGEYWRLK